MEVNLEMEMVEAVLKVVIKAKIHQIIKNPVLVGSQISHLWVTELPLMVN